MNFIDTNVIVYANDRRDPTRQSRALNLIQTEGQNRTGVVSIQVLQEFANTALNKLGQSAAIVIRQLALLEVLTIVNPDPPMVRRAVELSTLYPLSFWDAAILASAESSGCQNLFTEDLNHGQVFGNIRVVNPFLEA